MLGKAAREFNIVSNKYTQDHDTRKENDELMNKTSVDNRLKSCRKFNILTATYYDNKEEDMYQSRLAQTNQEWGKDFKKRFPPSWKYRENLVIDPSKEVPEEVLIVQKKKEDAKKRYKVRHILDKEYKVSLYFNCRKGI